VIAVVMGEEPRSNQSGQTTDVLEPVDWTKEIPLFERHATMA